MSLLPKDGWIFIGIDNENTQFFIDSNTIENNYDDTNVTVIVVPDDRGDVFPDFQKLLKEEKKDFTVLRYIEQSWGLNLSQGKYAIYGLIFKSEDGGIIHSTYFSAKSITWKFYQDERIAEKIALRVSNELDKKKEKERVKRTVEAKPKKTPSESVSQEAAGVCEENTQKKKMNIKTVPQPAQPVAKNNYCKIYYDKICEKVETNDDQFLSALAITAAGCTMRVFGELLELKPAEYKDGPTEPNPFADNINLLNDTALYKMFKLIAGEFFVSCHAYIAARYSDTEHKDAKNIYLKKLKHDFIEIFEYNDDDRAVVEELIRLYNSGDKGLLATLNKLYDYIFAKAYKIDKPDVTYSYIMFIAILTDEFNGFPSMVSEVVSDSKKIKNSKIESELIEHYTDGYVMLGFSKSEAKEIVSNMLARAKEESVKKETDSLPADYGDYLLRRESTDVDVKTMLEKKRNEGVTNKDIRWWWNMHDLERRMMLQQDDFMRSSYYNKLIEDQSLDEKKAVYMLIKTHPMFGDPEDDSLLSGEDRPLPYELKDRINIYLENISKMSKKNKENIIKETYESTSYNAFVRKQIKLGNT